MKSDTLSDSRDTGREPSTAVCARLRHLAAAIDMSALILKEIVGSFLEP